ncbi:hypothetical protein [Agrobacterium sp. LAD9]|uniref:hypothetical protein n=1 Tax=Agrobacterium sp. LAD9 TaxID=2055153 RepID=UPI000D1DEF01|nr:hypothetical protein [Agrobacterium sp. LAD9]
MSDNMAKLLALAALPPGSLVTEDMLPVSSKPVAEARKEPVVYVSNGLVRWVDDGQSYLIAYLGNVVVTEFYGDSDHISWSPDCLLREGDHYYTDRKASSLNEAKMQVEAYVAAWMADAGVVKAGAV